MSAILPKALTQFFDQNGKPIAGGAVYFYIPGTTTPKNTWEDEDLSILNTNPVILDASGSASIWGTGSYRQILRDQYGVTVWDRVIDSNDLAAETAAIYADFANTSDLGKGDALIGVKQPLPGTKARTQHDKNTDFITVLDFPGVDPTGVTDSSDGFQACLNVSNYLIMPPGKYRIDKQLTKNAAPIMFRGYNESLVTIECNTPSGCMFTHTPTTGDHYFDIGGFTLVGNMASSAGVRAIKVDGSAQLTSALYNGMRLTGEREKKRGEIHNINFYPADSSHGFAYGVQVSCLLNFELHNMDFVGPSDAIALEAWAIDGEGVPVDCRIYNIYAYNVIRPINLPDYVEGIDIEKYELVNCTELICNYYQAGRSVVPVSTTAQRSSNIRVRPGHGAFSGSQGMRFDTPAYLLIDKPFIVVISSTQPQKAAVYIGGTANFATICGVKGVNDHNTGAFPTFGIIAEKITNSRICDNATSGFAECFHAQDGSVTNLITGNTALWGGQATAVVLVGTNSVANDIYQNRGDLQNFLLTSLENRTGIASYSAIVSVMLVATPAGGSQSIVVNIPNRIFSNVPSYVSLSSLNGNGMMFEYNPTGSSASALAFVVHRADSAAVVAGGYTAALFAVSNVG